MVLLQIDSQSDKKGIFMVKVSARRPSLKVTGEGTGIVNHAGSRLVADVAHSAGLTRGLSRAMASTKKRRRGHDRGRVLIDLAVMLADGGETISDLRTLRDQPELFGEVASTPTAWRVLESVGPDQLDAIARARARARKAVWEAGADPGRYVIDIDGTLVNSHSDKEGAAPTYKKGYGFHPLVAHLDGTGEALATLLRPGNAGSGTATDHVTILDMALLQIPVDPSDTVVIARTDSAGCSHVFLEGCRERHVRFMVGHALTEEAAQAAVSVPNRHWQTAITADGTDECEGREVTEITDLIDLSGWPEGTRAIARREDPHPGAQLTFTDIDGRRYQVFLTDHPDPDICFLEAVYRGRGRAEKSICDAKDLGLANLPSADFAINTAWVTLVAIAQDLLAWTRILCLTGDLQRAEPKRLRYCLLHTAAVLARSGHTTKMHFAAGWPWTPHLVDAFAKLAAAPLRT